jgi:CRISPR-associated protein Csx10
MSKANRPAAVDGKDGVLPLRITFLSDWHIGEGAGRSGQIDRTIQRHPQDGLPYVPAKTLTGILRDACEKVARGLDEGRPGGDWDQFVKFLFGGETQLGERSPAAPRSAALHIGPARLDKALRGALCEASGKPIAQALTFVKPGVKLDPESGLAQEDHLRMEEVAIAGATLHGEITFAQELKGTQIREAVHALLWAGSRSLERIGGKRRRGAGHCDCSVGTSEPADEEKLLQILAIAPPAIPEPPSISLGKLDRLAAGKNGEWQRYALTVELKTPVIVPARIAGNVVETRDYIPGTLLVAALNRRLNGLLNPSKLPALAAGDVQIRNAYLAHDGKRLLPVPISLYQLKQKSAKATDLNLLRGKQQDSVQRKQCRDGYTLANSIEGDLVEVREVRQQSGAHATVDDAQQRPTERVGGVYTYNAIAAGQTFIAELWIRQHVVKAPDVDKLKGSFRIGRSKKDEYGQVEINVQKLDSPKKALADKSEFTLWLVSPLLLRDAQLRPSTDIETLQQALEQALQTRLVITGSHLRSCREDGWQTVWQAPRASRIGFAAGSCLLVKSADDSAIPGKLLAALQADGLGERRGEGYGEVRVNAPLLDVDTLSIHQPESTAGKPIPTQSRLEDDDFARQLLERYWRQEIERRALAMAFDTAFRKEALGFAGATPNSQLGNLRSYLEAARDEGGWERLSAWLKHLAGKTGEKTWQNSPLGLHQANKVWNWLEAPPRGELPGLGDITPASLKIKFSREALRLAWMAAIQAEGNARASQPRGGN